VRLWQRGHDGQTRNVVGWERAEKLSSWFKLAEIF
jgi:hypothetical protein